MDTSRYISRSRIQHRLEFLFRFFLGGVFLWAGGTKIVNPHEFANIISNYQLLPDSFVNIVAVWLPWIEVLCGLLLISGLWVEGSLVIINTLLIVFIVALVSNWIRGIDVDCGCFAVEVEEGESNYLIDIIRDLVLLAIGMFILHSRVRLHLD
jgi:uncharacterized membrane protein YphA (DoxX/SURF4 family)